mgnify:CR=1 FL=1
MLNQFANGLLVATSMAPMLGAVAVNQIAQNRPWNQWAPWLFPADKAPAMKLIQFLNEELFR